MKKKKLKVAGKARVTVVDPKTGTETFVGYWHDIKLEVK